MGFIQRPPSPTISATMIARDERGFTLIELLVALLLVGILATMALSSFLGRRVTAGDAVAKQLIHSAQDSALNYGLSTVNYSGMTPAALNTLDKTLNITANGQAVLVNAAPTATGYLLTVVSRTADTFNLTSTNGVVSRTCLVASGNGNTATNTGGGCLNGTW
jgi:prepilin-type N-terminal cleavage/methylation domain-containing protein